MRAILHLVTGTEDALAREVIARQQESAGNKVEVVDLGRADADYGALVEKIFEADSVEVW